MKRPVGVTILGVLAIVAGVINLIIALPYLGVSALSISWITGPIASVATGTLMLWGVLMVVFGGLLVAVGVAAFQQRPWAWVAGVVLFLLGLILSIIQLNVIGALAAGITTTAVLSAVGLVYLYTKSVRTAFDHEDGSIFHSGHHTPMGAA